MPWYFFFFQEFLKEFSTRFYAIALESRSFRNSIRSLYENSLGTPSEISPWNSPENLSGASKNVSKKIIGNLGIAFYEISPGNPLENLKEIQFHKDFFDVRMFFYENNQKFPRSSTEVRLDNSPLVNF